ncbi:hypothetical protein CTAYLR_008759 [Chrysophaeum taylorii]|uniref:Uncharacterized protein n=1 Tax=Chrysophaeum taylorii TaxID=2483200 RepID=A0AAD7UCZ3_9STRA|nr:hypothetical protein CTAYLR_008759 [Chrysophaeum taylorii]
MKLVTTTTMALSAEWGGLTPAGPFGRGVRRTLAREVKPGIWSLEQVQGAIYVHVPVRALIVRLREELVCYGAVAPTEEMLELLGEIEQQTQRLSAIVLPSTATEHKLFAIALARRRPDATLYVAPSQFSFPINLPNWVFFPRFTPLLEQPWPDEFPFLRLGPFVSEDGISNFEEFLFFHRESKTLLCCDTLLSLTETPPAIIDFNDPRAIKFHGRDFSNATAKDGWTKICLFALYFQCGALRVREPDGSLRGALDFILTAFPPDTPEDFQRLGWGRFFAWSWPEKQKTKQAFDTLSARGALMVPPILAIAILNRYPDDLARFLADDLWDDFDAVCPLHFDAPVHASKRHVLDAFNAAIFDPLGEPRLPVPFWHRPTRTPFPPADTRFLRDFEARLVDAGVIKPAA